MVRKVVQICLYFLRLMLGLQRQLPTFLLLVDLYIWAVLHLKINWINDAAH